VNDLRERANYDAEHHASDERTQYDLPAVKPAAKEPDCTVWTETVNHRLDRLERAVERLADTLQVLILRSDDGK